MTVNAEQLSVDGVSVRGLAQQLRSLRERVVAEVARVVVGMEAVTQQLLIALLAGGHVLLEGVPGVAKTTLSKTFARVLGTQYQRIQFTPDLLPSDVTGTYIYDRKHNDFVLRSGPIFCQVLLADEVNRAPAKTQSALLEAMQENQVTIEGTTLPLPLPFMVLATQNPVEQEGVYRLPEAQLDRFLVPRGDGLSRPQGRGVDAAAAQQTDGAVRPAVQCRADSRHAGTAGAGPRRRGAAGVHHRPGRGEPESSRRGVGSQSAGGVVSVALRPCSRLARRPPLLHARRRAGRRRRPCWAIGSSSGPRPRSKARTRSTWCVTC